MAYGEVIGNLHIDFTRSFADLNEEQRGERQSNIHELAAMASDQIALALANLKLRATLHYQSTRDPLTQLFNRRYLTESLERELCRAERSNLPVGVLIADIDHFKRYNDTYGHDAGDAVLREFGSLLRTLFRASDIPCRHGGEEFAIVLPDAPPDVVIARAQELCRRASAIEVEHLGNRVGRITISIGIAHYPISGTKFEDLLAAADRALYRAKSEGRNRVVEIDGDERMTMHPPLPKSGNVEPLSTSATASLAPPARRTIASMPESGAFDCLCVNH